MKQTIVWVLVAANVALAGTFAWRGVRENTAHAQPAGTQAPPLNRGKYVLIPGSSTTGVSIIYVFDSANMRLGAITPDARDVMNGIPTIDIRRTFEQASTGGVRPPDDNRGNNRPGGTNRR